MVGLLPLTHSRMFGCKMNHLFIVKCLINRHPFGVFAVLYGTSILVFGCAVRICERPFGR